MALDNHGGHGGGDAADSSPGAAKPRKKPGPKPKPTSIRLRTKASGRKRGENRSMRIQITYAGVTKTVRALHRQVRNMERFLARRDEVISAGKPDPVIKDLEGDHGERYYAPRLESEPFHTTKIKENLVRASRDHWGLTHDRFNSEHPNFAILAIHKLRAEWYSAASPDCKHAKAPKEGHVCEGFQILGEIESPAAVEEAVPDIKAEYDLSETDYVESEAAIDWEEPIGEAAPKTPGHGVLDVRDIIKALGTNTAPACFLQYRNEAEQLTLITGLKNNDGLNLYRESQAGPRPPSPSMPVKAGEYVNFDALSDLLAKSYPQPVAATDAAKTLGPDPENFQRDSLEGVQLIGAFQDAFRRKHLQHALTKRHQRSLVQQKDPEGNVMRNEFQEILWLAPKKNKETDP